MLTLICMFALGFVSFPLTLLSIATIHDVVWPHRNQWQPPLDESAADHRD